MTQIKNGLRLVVGLGKTGISVATYLQKKNIPFALADTRTNPPNMDIIKANFAQVPCHTGKIDPYLLSQAEEIILSPGVDPALPALQEARDKNIPIIGDVELFAREARAPICAITGSNGKSTVTHLVYCMANHASVAARMGGNVGIPVLDLLKKDEPDMYVLELSSFQLDTTYSLKAEAAVILNVTPDHLDRYPRFEDYVASKQNVYKNAVHNIFNRQDKHTYPANSNAIKLSFGLDQPQTYDFGLVSTAGGKYLALGEDLLISVRELLIKGQYNWNNALAALAMGYAMKLPMISMLSALGDFKGLDHRCEFVIQKEGVAWYNDSKGTNVGATQAALESVGDDLRGKIILLAGGIAKGQDFSSLKTSVEKYVKKTILFGVDAPFLEKTLNGSSEIVNAASLVEAVMYANHSASYGDAVLLSPACASFDMFRDYEERGEIFKKTVKALE